MIKKKMVFYTYLVYTLIFTNKQITHLPFYEYKHLKFSNLNNFRTLYLGIGKFTNKTNFFYLLGITLRRVVFIYLFIFLNLANKY